jgi:hypothetical protein
LGTDKHGGRSLDLLASPLAAVSNRDPVGGRNPTAAPDHVRGDAAITLLLDDFSPAVVEPGVSESQGIARRALDFAVRADLWW